MKIISLRFCYFYALCIVLCMALVSAYLEYGKGILPCPLCVLQRVILAGIGICFLIGSLCLLKKIGQTILGLFTLLLSLSGALLAGRQIWLQHLPLNNSADCGMSIQYLLKVLPLNEVIKKIFQGTAECSKVDWTFLHFTLAEWSFVWFIVFALFALFQTLRRC